MICLCDTNIISELARPQPNSGVIEWSASVTSIALSVITLEEITYGLTAKPNARIQAWFQSFLSKYCQIIPITSELLNWRVNCGDSFACKEVRDRKPIC